MGGNQTGENVKVRSQDMWKKEENKTCRVRKEAAEIINRNKNPEKIYTRCYISNLQLCLLKSMLLAKNVSNKICNRKVNFTKNIF